MQRGKNIKLDKLGTNKDEWQHNGSRMGYLELPSAEPKAAYMMMTPSPFEPKCSTNFSSSFWVVLFIYFFSFSPFSFIFVYSNL